MSAKLIVEIILVSQVLIGLYLDFKDKREFNKRIEERKKNLLSESIEIELDEEDLDYLYDLMKLSHTRNKNRYFRDVIKEITNEGE